MGVLIIRGMSISVKTVKLAYLKGMVVQQDGWLMNKLVSYVKWHIVS
jgi:hypothetical protein